MDAGKVGIPGAPVRVHPLIQSIFAALLPASALFLVFASSAFSGALPQFCEVDSATAVHGSSRLGRATESTGVRLVVNKSHVSRNARVFARLVNFGTESVGFGYEFSIERYTASTGWFVDSASPNGPWPKVRTVLKPGSAGRCYRFDVPDEQPHGRYRFSTKVEFHLDSPAPPRRRTAEFLVD